VNADPFGTQELRLAALQAWRSSPTRFREDANAEEDLVLGGYRDRWFVELAQNAADAAARAGAPGELRVSLVDGELRVANTGEPLDAAGVAALASLRASAKRDTRSVGRFGIGFAAVLPVSTEPRVISTTGGVAFSARRTKDLVDAEPRLREEVAQRAGRVPVLRLVWPVDPPVDPTAKPTAKPRAQPGEAPPAGFDTEVRLPLAGVTDADALLTEAAAQAADLLLALPALHRIDVAGRMYRRRELAGAGVSSGDGWDGTVELDEPDGSTRWRLVRRDGELPAELLTAADERHRPHWSVCWAVPVSPSGEPRPVGDDVLHAPTPTDERLSMPARLLATLPMDPSRRRIRHGTAADHVLAQAVRAYRELVAALPAEHRTALVPHAGFPLSDVDAALRDGVVAALRTATWLPAADGGAELSPSSASVLDTAAPRLVELLAGLVPGLAAAALSEPARAAAMVVLDVPRLGLADVVAAVTGVDRAPGWWHELYDALTPLVDVDPAARDELAALPVPLADGRTVTGPRGTIVVEGASTTHQGPALRVVHPDAVHPLLLRLGAQLSGPRELLDSVAMREAVERSVEDAEGGLDTVPLADTVLGLVTAAGDTAAQPWLGALALPEETGEPRRADELVLPDGALRAVLARDTPIGVLHPDVAARHPRDALRAVGVLDGFAVLVDDNPTAPDHDLADERRWWATLDEPPQRLVAVRDLDLVDDDAWPVALRLLAAGPGAGHAFHDAETGTSRALYDPDADTRRALHDPYTRWWLARHARLAGHPPRHWRLASATQLAGLYDPVPALRPTASDRVPEGAPEPPYAGLSRVSAPENAPYAGVSRVSGGVAMQDDELLAAAGVRTALDVTDDEDAADLLARLADPRRRPGPATVRAAHAALTKAAADSRFDVEELELPATVRAVSGATTDAAGAYVLDLSWLAGIADPDRAVAGGDPYLLAELLDLPLASEQLAADVVSTGRLTPWADLPEVAAASEAMGREVPPGTLTVHDRLTVRTTDGERHTVPYWVDGDAVHASDPVRALLWYGAIEGIPDRG